MKPTTSVEVTTKDNESITIRLGDMFTLPSELKVINPEQTHHYTALMLLTTAIVRSLGKKAYSAIHFTMIGVDKMAYTIAKTTKDELVLITHKGKEVSISKKHLIESIHYGFGPGSNSIVVKGIRIYMCIAISRLTDIRNANLSKVEPRAMDLALWPGISLIVWAKHHLKIPSEYIPAVEEILHKADMVEYMAKLNAVRNVNIPEPVEKHSISPYTADDIITVASAAHKDFIRGVNDRRGIVNPFIKFINLSANEVSTDTQKTSKLRSYKVVCSTNKISPNVPEIPETDRTLGICLLNDIGINDLEPYKVVCMENRPLWVIVQGQDSHDLRVPYISGPLGRGCIYIKLFGMASLVWVIRKILCTPTVRAHNTRTKVKAQTEVRPNNSFARAMYESAQLNNGEGPMLVDSLEEPEEILYDPERYRAEWPEKLISSPISSGSSWSKAPQEYGYKMEDQSSGEDEEI